jgi:5-aminolevulinate synthase
VRHYVLCLFSQNWTRLKELDGIIAFFMDYYTYFKKSLDGLKNEGRYRVFADLERLVGKAPYAKWHHDGTFHQVSVWCSNDYLGMSHHPAVIESMIEATKTYGAGSGGTRNISGTCHSHVLLEQAVASLHGKEAGLVFTSGYSANETALSTLGQCLKGCVILSDEKNHASMIQGIKLSGCEKRVFKHNDIEDLEHHLKSLPLETPKIIAFISVYSMDGDIAPIKEICDLADKYNALTYLDEVHAVGIYGPGGAGVAVRDNQHHRLDIIQANFAKAYGVIGGYITGSKDIVDFIRSHGAGFIFTTSLPPSVARAITASLNILRDDNSLRETLFKRVQYLKERLRYRQIPFVDNPSHIVPVVIGDAHLCKLLCHRLLHEHHMYVQPINYPTVPKGQERMRLTVTPFHSPSMIQDFVESLDSLWGHLEIKRAA